MKGLHLDTAHFQIKNSGRPIIDQKKKKTINKIISKKINAIKRLFN